MLPIWSEKQMSQILDLNAVTQMAKMESDGKFRVFHMIYAEQSLR